MKRVDIRFVDKYARGFPDTFIYSEDIQFVAFVTTNYCDLTTFSMSMFLKLKSTAIAD